MRTLLSLLLLYVMCSLPASALAQLAPSEVRLVSEARQVAFPNSGPRGESTHNEGDVVLKVPLLWESGAVTLDPATISADEERVAIVVGSVLQAVVLEDKSRQRFGAYCTQRRAAERSADSGVMGAMLGSGVLWRHAIRSATDRQLCLIDADDDGIADQSVLLNAGSPLARTPVNIPSVRLNRQTMIPISGGDWLQIKLADVSRNGRSVQIVLDIFQQGKPRAFDSFDGTTKSTHVSLRSAPQSLEIVRARFEVLSASGPDRTLTIRWPSEVDVKAMLQIPDAVQINVRPY